MIRFDVGQLVKGTQVFVGVDGRGGVEDLLDAAVGGRTSLLRGRPGAVGVTARQDGDRCSQEEDARDARSQ